MEGSIQQQGTYLLKKYGKSYKNRVAEIWTHIIHTAAKKHIPCCFMQVQPDGKRLITSHIKNTITQAIENTRELENSHTWKYTTELKLKWI